MLLFKVTFAFKILVMIDRRFACHKCTLNLERNVLYMPLRRYEIHELHINHVSRDRNSRVYNLPLDIVVTAAPLHYGN